MRTGKSGVRMKATISMALAKAQIVIFVLKVMDRSRTKLARWR
jgi:hypothetical protein